MSGDILQVQEINEKGYGTVSKIPMQDRQITPEAKAIYGYFCAFAGAGRTAFPSRDKIIADLVMSEKRYYKHFSLLKRYGYIDVKQENGNTGQFTRNIYTLIQNNCTEKNAQPCSHFARTQNDRTRACSHYEIETKTKAS